MASRVLKNGDNQITQTYAQHYDKVVNKKQGWAIGTDVVKKTSQCEYIIAHSIGYIFKVVNYMNGTNGQLDRDGMGYGNYVAILHEDNTVTLYAHLANVSSNIKVGTKVAKGTVLGFMGNTGNSFGAHLHFEIRQYKTAPTTTTLHDNTKFEFLNPEPYLNSDLPKVSSNSTNGSVNLTENSYADYTNPNDYYRVRKSFNDEKSSLGSWHIWKSAYNAWNINKDKGYHIYDKDGKQLDVVTTTNKPLTANSYSDYPTNSGKYYRIRKSFNDEKSSKGSFTVWKSAYNTWNANKTTHHIYDADGKQLD